MVVQFLVYSQGVAHMVSNSANIESMLSAIITATGGTLRVLNAISSGQQQLTNDVARVQEELKVQKEFTVALAKIYDNTEILKKSITTLIEAIQEASSHEDITSVKNELLEHLSQVDATIKTLDNAPIIESLVTSLQTMHENFEMETKSIRQLHKKIDDMTTVSEIMSSRIDSMDIRTADLYNHQIMQSAVDIPLDIQHQIEENNRLLAAMPQKQFDKHQ